MANIVFVTDGPPQAQSVVHRVGYTAQFLESRGHQVRILYGREQKFFGRRFARTKLSSWSRALLALSDVDIFILHRVGDPIIGLVAALARWKKKGLVVDLDDGIYLNKNLLTLSLDYLIRSSELVTAASHAIADHASKISRNVRILPAIVDTALFARRRGMSATKVPTIGWLGDGRVHANNLRVLLAPLRRLAKTHAFKLKLVSALGNPEIFETFGELATQIQVEYGSQHWVDISQIPDLMKDFDISVMPLVDNDYSRAKAGQKILESMAMGFPVVASSVGENPFIVSHGVDGFLVDSDDEWVRHLIQLIEDPTLRERMGAEGRKKVVKSYSREVCGQLFLNALNPWLARPRT